VGLIVDKDANMLTCNLFETIHNIWLQQSNKKCKDLFDAIVDDLIKALEQQTWCKFHLMGKLKGT
jgi:nucleoid DNA-binding protein